jgi:hypothetical protein
LLPSAAETLLVLCLSSLGIGAAITSRLRLHPAESLPVAIGLSWLVIFQLRFLAYLLGQPEPADRLLLGASLLGLLLGRRELARWARCRYARHMLAATAALMAWFLAHQAATLIYVGGWWYGDWFEHYERMLFFVHQKPLDTQFLGGMYILPARPPMQNVCQAHVARFGSDSFAAFQISSTFLGVLSVLPVFLLMRRLAERPGVNVWVGAALLAASWPLLSHVTFTWTKAFCAFYVLLGLALYRRGTPGRQLLAFVLLGSAVLVHYSAALALIPLLVWHVAASRKPASALPRALLRGLPGALLLLPWLLFVRTHFPGEFLGSTSSARMTVGLTPLGWGLRTVHNVLTTWLPIYSADNLDRLRELLTRAPLMGVRDVLFLVVNQSWVGAMQATGLVMLCIAAGRLRRERRLPPAAWFWLWAFFGTTLCLSFSHPALPDFGLAHIGLLPLILLVPAWIAAAWPTLSLTARRALVAALAVQMAVGPLFTTWLNSSTPLIATTGRLYPGLSATRTVTTWGQALLNLKLKHEAGLEFVAERIDAGLTPLAVALCIVGAGWVALLARESGRVGGRPGARPALHPPARPSRALAG